MPRIPGVFMVDRLSKQSQDGPQSFLEAIQTANLEYDLSDKVGAFTELIAFLPSGSLVAQPEYYFHAGFQFFITPNVQFDIHAGAGLNRAAADLAFTGAGLSWRF